MLAHDCFPDFVYCGHGIDTVTYTGSREAQDLFAGCEHVRHHTG